MIATLKEGACVGVTADVPRVGGIAGLGIVTLAKYSGRPIVPVAVATSNMIRLASWDHANVNLPFSRGAFVVGELVHVPRRCRRDDAGRTSGARSSTPSTPPTSAPTRWSGAASSRRARR